MPGSQCIQVYSICIVVVSAAAIAVTTVQIFIVVGMPATHVSYDSTNIYRRSHASYGCNTTLAKIYRRSHAGYVCTYDSSKKFIVKEGRKERRKDPQKFI